MHPNLKDISLIPCMVTIAKEILILSISIPLLTNSEWQSYYFTCIILKFEAAQSTYHALYEQLPFCKIVLY